MKKDKQVMLFKIQHKSKQPTSNMSDKSVHLLSAKKESNNNFQKRRQRTEKPKDLPHLLQNKTRTNLPSKLTSKNQVVALCPSPISGPIKSNINISINNTNITINNDR